MAKKLKYNPKYMFQYHIQIGNYPHVKFYSVSPFNFLSRDAARQAANHMMEKEGINPNKAKIHTNQRELYFKSNMYSGFNKGVALNHG